MRLFSYTVAHDTGFAPNPFFGYCTLACCKPRIRLSAQKGDWVVGLTSKTRGSRLLFAMKVSEKLTFDQYWRQRRFAPKRPKWTSDRLIQRVGDNIYQPTANGQYRQLPSMHSDGDREDCDNKRNDLSGQFALIAADFHYFGSSPIPLPSEFEALIVGRGYKCRFHAALAAAFERWIQHFRNGVAAAPTKWPEADKSWSRLC